MQSIVDPGKKIVLETMREEQSEESEFGEPPEPGDAESMLVEQISGR